MRSRWNPRRLAGLTWALFLRWLYLLLLGMWRGEGAFDGWHAEDGRHSAVAAGKGSILNGTFRVTRWFWNEHTED